MCETCSKLTKTAEQRQSCRSGVLTADFEQITLVVLAFLLMILKVDTGLINVLQISIVKGN